MEIVIAGGHGKIALLSERLLTGAGHTVRALIRNPAHEAEVEATGAQPVIADLEQLEPDQLVPLLQTADALVYGAGPGSGPARKWTMDYGGAIKLIEACKRAKGMADAELEKSGLRYTIIQPVGLTDEPAAIVAVLERPATAGLTFILRSGSDTVQAAIDSLATAA